MGRGQAVSVSKEMMFKDHVHGNDRWMRIRRLWLQAGYQILPPYRGKVEMELILGGIASWEDEWN